MDKKSNEQILNLFSDNKQPFLTDLTQEQDYQVKLVKGKIKVKRKPTWDEQKDYSLKVADILDMGDSSDLKRAERIRACSNMLEMGWVDDIDGNPVLKLKKTYSCHVPRCPICQWRRSKKWSARFFEALPLIFSENKNMRFIFLTLTVANCPISELRATVRLMSNAWDKMSRRKKFPALGFVRSFEVTKEKNLYDKSGKKLIRAARPDYCHPHFHVLMAVPQSYFNNGYMSKDVYAEMWQKALKVDYKPVVDIRIVKPKEVKDETGKPVFEGEKAEFEGMKAALVEVVKYTVKPSDMVESPSWLLELVRQLHKIHAVALGGIFKDYLKVNDDGDLTIKEDLKGNEGGYLFNWRSDFRRYRYYGKAVNLKNKAKVGRGFYHFFDWFEVLHFSLLSPRAQCLVIQELGF
jgi:plasmid rolling circle replication initiator protein Rep